MSSAGARPHMSVFEHHVAHCAIAHQKAMRAAREQTAREASELTIALFRKMHRLSDLALEMGAAAVFEAPAQPLGDAEIRRLFPE